MTERIGLPFPPRGMCREVAALYVGVGTTTFDELVADGLMPGPVHGCKRPLWEQSQLDEAFTELSGGPSATTALDALVRFHGKMTTRAYDEPEGAGTIYVVQALPLSPVKIGFTSKHPLDRITELQIGNPHPLKILATVRGTMADERKIHKSLSSVRLTGEWFEWTDLTRDFVAFLSQNITGK